MTKCAASAPAERAAVFDSLNLVIAALHRTGLADYGKPGNYFTRQIGSWTSQYRASETEPIAAMNARIDWLPQTIPVDDTTFAAPPSARASCAARSTARPAARARWLPAGAH